MADEIELAPAASGPSKLKIAAIVAIGVLVAAGGTVGALYAMGMLPGVNGAAVQAEAGAAPDAPDAMADEPPEEAVYVALDPPFTVNFTDAGAVRYLQLTVQAMTRDPEIESEIKRHMPVIRNDLMLLFSAKSSSELSSREGKQELQAEALASIQGILEREAGTPGVEAIYFTSFMMQ